MTKSIQELSYLEEPLEKLLSERIPGLPLPLTGYNICLLFLNWSWLWLGWCNWRQGTCNWGFTGIFHHIISIIFIIMVGASSSCRVVILS